MGLKLLFVERAGEKAEILIRGLLQIKLISIQKKIFLIIKNILFNPNSRGRVLL